MSLKVKLTSTICAFLLILGLVITGVFAVPQAQVNLGGTLTFSAKDVYARVTGTISGSATENDITLTPIEFNAGSASGESEWKSDLAFKDDGSTITISITVENLATDRPLYVSMTDNVGNVENVTKSLTNGAFELAAGEDATATITMEVTDKNESLSGATYGYLIELLDESAIQSYDAVEGLTFSCDTDARTATLTGNTLTEATDVVLPAYVKSGDIVCAVTKIGSSAFWDMQGVKYLKSIVLPNTLTNIDAGAFVNSSDIADIIIPTTVSLIAQNAFMSCSSLKNIALPEGISSIAMNTFSGCSSLTTITIPNSVTSIGISAFQNCSALTTVNYLGNQSEWEAIRTDSLGTGIPSTTTIKFLGA